MDRAQMGAVTAWFLVLSCALGLLAVPAWRTADPETGQDAWPLAPLVEGWDRARSASGPVEANREILAALDRFETQLDESSPVLRTALPDLQWLQLRFGGRGNETVYPGAPGAASEESGGWLLLRSGYDHLVGRPFLDPHVLETRRRGAESWRPEPDPDPRPALRALHRRLEEQGIDLVLLPVPTKPAVEAASLAPAAPRPLANPSLQPFVREMERAGLHVFDVRSVLHELSQGGTPAYLRTDSHWSPAAVEAVAKALAAWLTDTFGDDLGPADAFWQATATERTGRGDLWRLLRLPEEKPLYAEETVRAQEISAWDGRLWAPDDQASVLVLGDSFVNVYSDESLHWGRAAGFAEQLAFHLERGVDRMARNDGASDQVRRDLARAPERLATKRVVVYQFAERELSVGDWPVL